MICLIKKENFIQSPLMESFIVHEQQKREHTTENSPFCFLLSPLDNQKSRTQVSDKCHYD